MQIGLILLVFNAGAKTDQAYMEKWAQTRMAR